MFVGVAAFFATGVLFLSCRATTRRTSVVLLVNYVFAWASMLAAIYVAATELSPAIDLFYFDSMATRRLAEATVGYLLAEIAAVSLIRREARERFRDWWHYHTFHAVVAFAFCTYLHLGTGGICVVLSLIGELAGICIHHTRYAWEADWHHAGRRPRAYLILFVIRALAAVMCKGVCFTWLAVRAIRDPRLWSGGPATLTQMVVIVLVAVHGSAFSAGACHDAWKLAKQQKLSWSMSWKRAQLSRSRDIRR